MRKKRLKKALAIVLSAVMMIGVVNFMPGSVIEVKADAPTVKDVNLGFGGIENPTSTGSDATAWTGNKVYYGNHLWRVLDNSGFLFSEDLLGAKAYNDPYNSTTWEECTLRVYLNGTNNEGSTGTLLGDTFTTAEQGAINLSTVSNENNPDFATSGGNATADKLFSLSLVEAKNSSYGFGSNATRSASYWWWLRSPGYDDSRAASVNSNGSISSHGNFVDDADGSVRPAFHLNLSSVLFTFASGASKSSFAEVENSNVSSNTWKLTLKGTDTILSAQTTDGITSLQAGYSAENLTIGHSEATTLTGASQVSAMLTDSNGTVLYYGSINSNTAATSSNVTIPAGLSAGSYSLYVFAEDVNTGNLTDYASALGTEIPITVNAAPNPPTLYQVTVNNGSGDGTYVEGATVSITADSPASGKQFKNWTVESGSVNLASSISETTTFTMPAGEVVITATYEDVTTQTETYVIQSGANGTHQIGGNGTLTIICSGALADLTGIYIDGKLVDSSHYTLKSGSTILTLKADYLNGLSVGTHTLIFMYGSNKAETSFQITAADSGTTDSKASDTDTASTDAVTATTTTTSGKDDVPKTGDHTPVAVLIVLAMISGAGVFYFGIRKKFIEK